MSAPSITASQTGFCNAMYRVNATPEPPSGCGIPIPITRISDRTLNPLNTVKLSIEDEHSIDTPMTGGNISQPGIAMGTSLTPNYANLSVDRFEAKVHHMCILKSHLHD